MPIEKMYKVERPAGMSNAAKAFVPVCSDATEFESYNDEGGYDPGSCIVVWFDTAHLPDPKLLGVVHALVRVHAYAEDCVYIGYDNADKIPMGIMADLEQMYDGRGKFTEETDISPELFDKAVNGQFPMIRIEVFTGMQADYDLLIKHPLVEVVK